MTEPQPRGTTRLVAIRAPHGVSDHLVVTILRGGILRIREYRRRKAYELDLGVLYLQTLLREVKVRKPKKRRLSLF